MEGDRRRFAPLAGGALLAAAALASPWPPSTDLAGSEGMLSLLVHYGDPVRAPRDVYALSLGHQGQLFYLLAYLPALVVGAGLACRLLFAASVAAVVVLAGRTGAYLGRSPWAALAVAPAALGASFYEGAAPQLLGFALWLGALPLLDAAAERPTGRRMALASLAIVVLGLASSTGLACGFFAAAVFALARRPDRFTPARLFPAALAAALTGLELVWQARVQTPLARLYASRVLWKALGAKLASLGHALLGPQGAVMEGMIALLAVVTVFLWRVRPPEPEHAAPGDPAARPRAIRLLALAGVLFVVVLLAPFSVNYGANLYAVFLGPAYAAAVLSLAPPARARGAVLAAPAIALAIASLVAAAPQIDAARRHAEAVGPLLARIDPGSPVWIASFGRGDPALAFDPIGLGYRVIAERGGRTVFSLAEHPNAPVVVRPGKRWDATLMRTVTERSAALRPAYDLARFRWVLAQVHDEVLAATVIRAMRPEGELVDARGEWLLFRSRLAPVSPTAPDGDPPATAETLQVRVDRLLSR